MHVVVQSAVSEQQLSFEIRRQVLVGLRVIVVTAVGVFFEQALVFFRLRKMVAPVVVVPGAGDGDFKEIGMAQDGIG